MTHKIYTGTLTDAHGREWLPFFLLTAKEFKAMKKAGVLPEDIRRVTGLLNDTANEAVSATYAKTALKRMMDGVAV